MKRFRLFSLVLTLLTLGIIHGTAQTVVGKYNEDLYNYVKNEYLGYQLRNYDRDRYLVGLLQVTNEQLRQQIGDPREARRNYFESLLATQKEVRRLQAGFGQPGDYLYDKAADLDAEITRIVQAGIIDKTTKAAIEDALQLLTMAADDPSIAANEDPLKNLTNEQRARMRAALAGEKDNEYSQAITSGEISLYDLYREWRQLNTVDFFTRLTDLRLIRRDLYRRSTSLQRQAMFAIELEHALRAFNLRNYDYASRFFNEMLTFYPRIEPADDILFFLGEADFALQRFASAADRGYQPLLDRYPESAYRDRVEMRLVQIYHTQKNFINVLQHAEAFFAKGGESKTTADDVRLLAGIAAAQTGDYGRGRAYLESVTFTSSYWPLAQILTGNLFSADKQYERAQERYAAVLASSGLRLNMRDQAIVYSGLTYYMSGEYQRAINTLKEISPEFKAYDMALIGTVWADYKMNNLLPADMRDFSIAKQNAGFILNNIYASEYELEAKSLLAQITELEGNIESASMRYMEIERYFKLHRNAELFTQEREAYRALKAQSQRVMAEAIQSGDTTSYRKALQIRKKSMRVLAAMNYVDYTTSGHRYVSEVNRLKSEIEKAENTKRRAEAERDENGIFAADTLIQNLTAEFQLLARETDSRYVANYFEQGPVAKLEAERVSINKNLDSTLFYIARERQDLIAKRKELNRKIETAKRQGNYRDVAFAEIARDEIDAILVRMDELYTRAQLNEKQDIVSNVGGWADFGAFGIVNARIMETENYRKQQVDYANKVERIDGILAARKVKIENQIFRIEEEIALMTRKVKEQRRRREREEKFREFEESYFDRRESETDLQGLGSEIRDETSGDGVSGGATPIDDQPSQDTDSPQEILDMPAETPAEEPANDSETQQDLLNDLENLPGSGNDGENK
jgi:hypothetical protein